MPSAGSVIGAWHPKTESERQLVRSQLERLVSDSRFTASKRYPGMLQYIVEQTLRENEDSLKERTIGIEVFHRPPDYDTNLDPVVRLCAVEVRKRLVQYYQSSAHANELRIELNPGSYVPVFSEPPSDAHILQTPLANVPSIQTPPSDVPSIQMPPVDVPSIAEPVNQSKRTEKIYWPVGLIVSGLIVVIVALGARYGRQFNKQRSALEEVWSPLLTSSKPILLCVGGTKMVNLAGSQLIELQSGADDDAFLQPFANRNDFVPFSDVQVLSRFSSLADAHGHAFRVQNSRTTVSSQLREGPVVLIGALNNDWTLNRTSSLRFHFQRPVDSNPVYWIADTQHPESHAWQVNAQARASDVLKDYAIAARFTDEGTGQIVLVAAGITGSGTRAAGEFLTDEAALKQLADSAGADWGKKNFEVVLSAQVVNGMQGKPTVEAKTFW
jgi:hypothetical protein